jgi:hypothetical protein
MLHCPRRRLNFVPGSIERHSARVAFYDDAPVGIVISGLHLRARIVP